MSDASAQHDRSAILHRVAAAIWSAGPDAPAMSWPTAIITARHPSQVALADAVERTKAEARAAVGALMIGTASRTEDVRLAMAGEHATGIVGGLCVEAFDAMLTETLE